MRTTSPNLDDLRHYSLTHSAVEHAFLRSVKTGQVHPFDMAHVMRAYAGYSSKFPMLITALFDHAIPRTARSLIEEVLEEERADHAGVSHANLLSRTADSFCVDYDSELLAAMRAEATCYAASVSATVRLGLGHALGALGPATEWIVPIIYTNFVEWWTLRAPVVATDEFFAFHVDADELHAELFERAITLCLATDTVGLADVQEGCATTLVARAKLWDGLEGLCHAP